MTQGRARRIGSGPATGPNTSAGTSAGISSRTSFGTSTGAADLRLGIDGCRGGWVWVANQGSDWDCGLAPSLTALAGRLEQAALALIDIPIGLPSGGPAERACDRAARALLGRPRAASVFRTPCRPVLAASDYPSACAISRAHSGVALSCQTWNILAKIRETDQLLATRPGLHQRLWEAHPELCLYGLAGGQPMQHPKRQPAGARERLTLLARHAPNALACVEALVQRQRQRDLARDDAIDAAALAVTAMLLREQPAIRLPPAPLRDARGLPMGLVYVLTAAA